MERERGAEGAQRRGADRRGGGGREAEQKPRTEATGAATGDAGRGGGVHAWGGGIKRRRGLKKGQNRRHSILEHGVI